MLLSAASLNLERSQNGVLGEWLTVEHGRVLGKIRLHVRAS